MTTELATRGYRYSTGSSTVMMRRPPILLSRLTIIARVVDFPEPVAPVTITNPSLDRARRRAKLRWETRPGEVRNGLWDQSQACPDVAPDVEQIDAEPGNPAAAPHGEGEIEALLRKKRPRAAAGQRAVSSAAHSSAASGGSSSSTRLPFRRSVGG